ncbi:MAG: hypothetical protein ACOCUF_01740 [Patescibacteria group bacterium]
MGFFNFKKKKEESETPAKNDPMDQVDDMLDQVDQSKLSKKEKWALKLFKKMPKSKKEEALRQMMDPQTLYKEKDKILKQLDDAVKDGQMSKQEAEQLKSQLGLR